MRRVLYFIFVSIALLACDSGGNTKEPPPVETPPRPQYYSKDSIHNYSASDGFLYKQTDDAIAWKKPLTIPDAKTITIDLGYGEVKTWEIDFTKRDAYVVLETNANIVVYWFYRHYPESISDDQVYFGLHVIGIYSLDGEFIKNTALEDSPYDFRYFMGMPSEQIFMLQPCGGYVVLSSTGELLKQTTCERKPETIGSLEMEIPWFGTTIFLDEWHYITYGMADYEIEGSIYKEQFVDVAIFDLEKEEAVRFYLKKIIDKLYLNEIHPPKCSIAEITWNEQYIYAIIDVTLYSGDKETLNLTFDYSGNEVKD